MFLENIPCTEADGVYAGPAGIPEEEFPVDPNPDVEALAPAFAPEDADDDADLGVGLLREGMGAVGFDVPVNVVD